MTEGVSCIARGHDCVRVRIDGRWYWQCTRCPHRLIAAAPWVDPTGFPCELDDLP
jgi:hypothetical protein